MKPKTMILMVVAVGCGLVASYMTSRLLADRNQAPDNMVSVVVAKPGKKVPAFTLVKKPEDLFEVRQVQEGPMTAKAVKTLEELQGKRLKNSINDEAIVRVDDLLRKEDLPIDVPKGQRAISIQVSAKTQAAGFILPGSRVDILCTMRRRDDPTTMTILQNMLVLAVDSTSTRADDQKAMLGQTVTLAATPGECERLQLAGTQGELCLALRGVDDKRPVTIAPAKISDFGRNVPDRDVETGLPTEADATNPTLGLGKVADATPTPQPEPPPVEVAPAKTHTMTIQEGSFVRHVVFTWDEENQTWHHNSGSREKDDSPATAMKPAPAAPALVPAPATNPTEKPKG